MPVESISTYNYGIVLMDNYSQASWVLLLRAKSDAPVEFERWAKLMEMGLIRASGQWCLTMRRN